MKVFKSQENPFMVIAHRGDSRNAPENTMPAFKQAHQKGADMIELDVILTKDNVPVVVHDNDLKKYGYSGLKITNMVYHDLQQIDAGAWFSKSFRGESIPTLEQVLEWAHDKILLNIEIKPGSVTDRNDGGVEEIVIHLVQKYSMRENVLLSSFDYRVPERVKSMAPEILTGLLYNKEYGSVLPPADLLKKYRADTFHCTWLELYRLEMDGLKQHKVPIFIYTVNNKWMMKKLIKKGVSGIFTDKPGLLKSVAKKMERSLWD